jgi:hypothetical protein
MNDFLEANEDTYVIDDELINYLKSQLLDNSQKYSEIEEQYNEIGQNIFKLEERIGEIQIMELRNEAVLKLYPVDIHENRKKLHESRNYFNELYQKKKKITDEMSNNNDNYNCSEIDLIDKQLDEFYHLENKTINLENDVERRKLLDWTNEKKQIKKEIDDLTPVLKQINKSMQHIYSQMKKNIHNINIQEWKPKYLKYFNNIEAKLPVAKSISESIKIDEKMIIMCNNYHQKYLLNNYLIKGSCSLSNVEKNITCDGWYVRKKYCECGLSKKYKWITDLFNPNNLDIFNIEHDKPYGYKIECY